MRIVMTEFHSIAAQPTGRAFAKPTALSDQDGCRVSTVTQIRTAIKVTHAFGLACAALVLIGCAWMSDPAEAGFATLARCQSRCYWPERVMARLAIRRIASLGRPALLVPAPSNTCVGPNISCPFEDLARTILALELGRQRRFDPIPGKPSCQHGQRIVQIDHRVDASAKKSGRQDPRIPRKSPLRIAILKRFGAPRLLQKLSNHAGYSGFARPLTS